MIFLASFCNIFKFKRNANVIIHNLFYPSNDVSVCVLYVVNRLAKQRP